MLIVQLVCFLFAAGQQCFACDSSNNLYIKQEGLLFRLSDAKCITLNVRKEYSLLQENMERNQEGIQAHRQDSQIRRRLDTRSRPHLDRRW